METQHFFMSLLAFTCGILSAKWAMELGYSQLAQVLWGVAGLLLGPLTLLLLYVRLLGIRQTKREPGGQWVSDRAEAARHETPEVRV
jgi:hypothetical protein